MKRIDVSEEAYTNVTNILASIAKPFHVRKGEYLQRAGVPEAMWFNVPVNFVLE